MSAAGWHGELWLGSDFALLRGGAGATTRHAHYAHQLLLSADAPVGVELPAGSVEAYCVLIRSMEPHAVLSAPPSLLTVFAEPVSIDAEALAASAQAADAAPDTLLAALRALPRRSLPDGRVARALAEIDAGLDERLPAARLARDLQLSLSQLERLFDRHVGVPIRALLRWRRLRLALLLALQGATLTEAAHGAGFADSAHLSRTMRATFGVRADRTLPLLRLQRV